MRKLIIALLFIPLYSIAQKKQITLEDIYKSSVFKNSYVPDINEMNVDSLVADGDIKDENGKKISLRDYIVSNDGRKVSMNPYVVSDDGKRILVFTSKENIYRRSWKAFVYLYDIISKKTIKLDNEKIMHASFSPDGSKIAFVKNNNLYLYDIPTGHSRAVTTDGKWNYIINGNCD